MFLSKSLVCCHYNLLSGQIEAEECGYFQGAEKVCKCAGTVFPFVDEGHERIFAVPSSARSFSAIPT